MIRWERRARAPVLLSVGAHVAALGVAFLLACVPLAWPARRSAP